MAESRQDTIRTLITTVYERAAAGDFAYLDTVLADDFRFIEASSLPYGGTYEGREGFRAVWAKLVEFWTDLSSEIHDITVSENHAVGLITLHATAVADGSRHAMPIAEVFAIDADGRIATITAYYLDSAAVAAACALPA